jgi:hypothetical protein
MAQLLRAGWNSFAKSSKGVLFMIICPTIQLTLPSLLLEVEQGLGYLQKQRKSFRGRVKQFTKGTSIQDELAGYKSRLNELRTNFTVSQTNAIYLNQLTSLLAHIGNEYR